MYNNKAIHILRTFSAWELNSLDKYLRSPFFNQQEKILQLWELLRSCYPNFDQPILERHQLFSQIFPQKTYHPPLLRHLLSDFTRLCEGFMAYQQWQQHPEQRQLHLLAAYDQRGLSKYHRESSKKLDKQILASAPSTTQSFTQRFLFQEARYLSSLNTQSRTSAYPVDSVIEALDQLYVAKKLRYSCELINRANIYQESYQLFLTDQLSANWSKFPHLHASLISLYDLTLKTLQDPENEAAYFELKEGLQQAIGSVAIEELRHLFAFALNYCIKRLNQGKEPFAGEIFELYKILVQNEIIFEQGVLPVAHFKNIVTLGARLKEFAWTEAFIETYQSTLAESERENAVSYNLANLLFAKEDFKRVLQLLRNVEFTDVFLQMDAKSILVKTYYELDDFDGLSYLLSSFKMALRRDKKLSSYQHRLYSNLIKFTRLLMRHQLGEPISIAYIEDQLAKHPNVAGGAWIREKLSAIE